MVQFDMSYECVVFVCVCRADCPGPCRVLAGEQIYGLAEGYITILYIVQYPLTSLKKTNKN